MLLETDLDEMTPFSHDFARASEPLALQPLALHKEGHKEGHHELEFYRPFPHEPHALTDWILMYLRDSAFFLPSRRVVARFLVHAQRLRRERCAPGKRLERLVACARGTTWELLCQQGDAEATRIYAEAYNIDPEFYAFVRSLEAYRKTIGEGTTLVLSPPASLPMFMVERSRP